MSPPRPKTPDPDSDPARSEAEKIERWKRIDELLEAALERPDSERADFLEAACAGDQSLRSEVEALLNADARTSGFIESPAAALAAEIIKDQPALVAGQQIGRYRIISLSGRGGMGAVYLAEDTTLRRRVALKLLRPDFRTSEDRLRRFEQEARAASSLNHPNILVIHEIGSERDVHFIVTEYVQGETLRDRILRSRLSVAEALDLAVQVASGLAEAHQAGIIHRDIKPENMMLRADGLVKVLDFGLAKLIEQHSSAVDAEAPTMAKLDTEPGTILGTVNYMSPEQARGQEVDARSDTFSLGVVIYEMITGRLPFEGDTKTDVLASILNLQPVVLSRYSPEAPEELRRIVSKALAKDRDGRYQSTKDLLIDLKTLKQKLAFEFELERSTSPDAIATAVQTSVTGQVSARTTSSAAYFTTTIRRHKLRAALFVAASLVAFATIAYFNRGSAEKPIESLAILPFVNADNDPNAEYLSDGITETLINNFSQLPRLKVTARPAAFRYKNREVDPQKAGRELSVQSVLMGRVIQRGENLVVQADLINVSDGSQMWGERYNRKMSDIFAVQDDIARAITARLRLKLTGEQQALVTRKYTDNTEAYQEYLKGIFWWTKLTPEGLQRGLEHFNRAIEIDPEYALAHAGLASDYAVLCTNGFVRPNEGFPKAKAAAMKALAMDPLLSEAHSSLSFIRQAYDWDWQGAEEHADRAIELNPDYRFAHIARGLYLTIMGRHAEAIAEMKKAEQLDPLSAQMSWLVGYAQYHARLYDQTIEQLKRSLEMDSSFFNSYLYLGLAYKQKGMYAEAMNAFQQALTLFPDWAPSLSQTGCIEALRGRKGQALKIIERLRQIRSRRYAPGVHVALIYIALGDKDRAFEWLEKSVEEHELRVTLLKVDADLDSLRSDPRFAALVRRVGLPE